MLFQGQEFVDDTPFPFGRDVGIDWSKSTTFSGITQMVTDLIHLRRNWNAQTRGLSGNNVNVFHVNNAAKVVAYHRWANGGPGDDVVVVANFSNVAFASYDLGLPRGGQWHVRFNGDWNGYSPDFANTASNDPWASDGGKDGLSFHGSVGVGPYSVVILSQ
jgi:1,4-alpha-glucan branching enzyme